MSAVRRLTLATGGPSTWTGCYAGIDVITDFPWTGLAPGTDAIDAAVDQAARGKTATEIAARGFLADAEREFRCTWEGRRALLTISGIGDIVVDLDRGVALAQGTDRAAARDATAAVGLALTGPALALLLAARGTWMLHGSAIRHGDAAIVLLGESGVGKSTLARHYGRSGRRLADDLVACRRGDPGLILPGPLPQPRLPREFAPAERMPMARIVVLDPNGGTPSIRALSAADQSLALVRHTVAARLFPPWLLEAQLAWAAEAAAQDRCVALSYEQVPAKLPAMLELLDKL